MKTMLLAAATLVTLALSGCAFSDDFIEAASQANRSSSTTAKTQNQKDWESFDRYRRQGPTDHSATGIR